MAILRSPKNKNHFMLTDSTERERQTWGKAKDSSKRDTKNDKRLDTVFPQLPNNQQRTEVNRVEGPNDSVAEQSIRSRKYTATFPVNANTPLYNGGIETTTQGSKTQSRARNLSTIDIQTVGSGTSTSRNLQKRRFTVEQGYSDQKTNRKIPPVSTVSAVSFTSREG